MFSKKPIPSFGAFQMLIAVALLTSCAATSKPIPVAITIDDLPWVGPIARGDTPIAATKRLLQKLRAHKAPVMAFVVCDRFVDKKTGSNRRDEILRLWKDAGHALGNHSARHKSLDGTTPEAWLDDVKRCNDALRPFAASPHFRFPYLRQGKTAERREAGLAGLAALGLTTAHVTIDLADWVLADAYVSAKNRGDTNTERAIVAAYIDYVVAAARRYRDIARTKVGHDIAHVAVFHANALNADHFDKILAALTHAGFSFVTLDRALADPVYRLRDEYVGPIGLSWLYRIAPVTAKDWAWDEAQEASLRKRFPAPQRSAAPPADATRINDELTVRQLSPNVWVVTHQRPTPSNTLAVRVADGSVILVSSPFDAVATRAVIGWLKQSFGSARIVAINSHHHFDGTGGNEALVAAGIPVYGSDATARLLRERGDAMRKGMLAYWGKSHPTMTDRFRAIRAVAPTNLFNLSDGLRLNFGGSEVHAIFPGHAHSPDNIVVHFPRERVLFGGCLIKAGDWIGNTRDADLAAWPNAVDRLRSLDATWIIPGHGLRFSRDLLDNTARVVNKAAAK